MTSSSLTLMMRSVRCDVGGDGGCGCGGDGDGARNGCRGCGTRIGGLVDEGRQHPHYRPSCCPPESATDCSSSPTSG